MGVGEGDEGLLAWPLPCHKPGGFGPLCNCPQCSRRLFAASEEVRDPSAEDESKLAFLRGVWPPGLIRDNAGGKLRSRPVSPHALAGFSQKWSQECFHQFTGRRGHFFPPLHFPGFQELVQDL